MVPEELRGYVGQGGVVALLAFVVGALVWLAKRDALNATLRRMGLPAIPKAALPWVALGLGAALSGLDAVLVGKPPGEAATAALWGVLSGGFAVAGHETLGKQAGKRIHARRGPKESR